MEKSFSVSLQALVFAVGLRLVVSEQVWRRPSCVFCSSSTSQEDAAPRTLEDDEEEGDDAVDNDHSEGACASVALHGGVHNVLVGVGMAVVDTWDHQDPLGMGVDGVSEEAMTSCVKVVGHQQQLSYYLHVVVYLVGSMEVRLGVHTDAVARDMDGVDTYSQSSVVSYHASRSHVSCRSFCLHFSLTCSVLHCSK